VLSPPETVTHPSSVQPLFAFGFARVLNDWPKAAGSPTDDHGGLNPLLLKRMLRQLMP
jgi:hypothetical protein